MHKINNNLAPLPSQPRFVFVPVSSSVFHKVVVVVVDVVLLLLMLLLLCVCVSVCVCARARVCVCVCKLRKVLVCLRCNFCIFSNCSLNFKICSNMCCVL